MVYVADVLEMGDETFVTIVMDKTKCCIFFEHESTAPDGQCDITDGPCKVDDCPIEKVIMDKIRRE